MSVTGYLVLLTRQVMCEEFSECYDDVGICFWTDGSRLTWSAAQTVCQQRKSFLPRITKHNISSKLREFRYDAWYWLGDSDFWIDVKAVNSNNWHWVDGSPLAG